MLRVPNANRRSTDFTCAIDYCARFTLNPLHDESDWVSIALNSLRQLDDCRPLF